MRAILLIVALAFAISSDATLVCNGDSNTQSSWQGYPNGTADGWCEQVGGINRGVGGTTISDSGLYYGTLPLWGGYYIDAELAGADPFATFAAGTPPTFLDQPIYAPFPAPDIVVMAFGTNDVRNGSWTPTQILAAYKKYRQHISAAGAVPYIGTTPPIFNADCTLNATYDAAIKSLNRKIRGNWPTKYIEFYEGFECSDFMSDGLHLTAAGQVKRAVAAAAALP